MKIASIVTLVPTPPNIVLGDDGTRDMDKKIQEFIRYKDWDVVIEDGRVCQFYTDKEYIYISGLNEGECQFIKVFEEKFNAIWQERTKKFSIPKLKRTHLAHAFEALRSSNFTVLEIL